MCVGAFLVGLLFVCFFVCGRGNKKTNENKQTQESRVRLLEYYEAHKWYMRNTPPKYIKDAPFTFRQHPGHARAFSQDCERADAGDVEGTLRISADLVIV